MIHLTRRDVLSLGLAAALGPRPATADRPRRNVHEQILDLAGKLQAQRRARFAAVRSKEDLAGLQKTLREKFLALLDGLPKSDGLPPVRKLGRLEGDDYWVEKLVFESFPGYFVSALLYRPKKGGGPLPGIISPCGHSAVGKAAAAYQILHVNLAKRGFVVLTYDPVGQGERSQFWDARRGRSRYNLTCGEHCVLGNPLYLLGTSLARYRVWDGIRALDYLASLEDVNADRLGCVGNSGGGTLTAYISALDPRVRAAVIGCYITTLPRRMGNRIQADPDSDPEQDVFGFVGDGIDHAGLLALRAPRPTLLCAARRDFFPIEGTRETFAEAAHLYEVAGARERVSRVEADQKHGLTRPLRQAAYAWFQRWLAGRPDGRAEEVAVTPRSARDLQVCPDGQVNISFKSRSLLPLAWEVFKKRKKAARRSVKGLLNLDPELADFRLADIAPRGKPGPHYLLCINGNETADWRTEKAFLQACGQAGVAVGVVDVRGVGKLRADLQVRGHDYADPLCGVEENIAYNAFLVGKSLVGMRVADVLAVVKSLLARNKAARLVLCARRDVALVACLAATLEPGIRAVAVEGMFLSFHPLFEPPGRAVNASTILPRLLRDFGDVPEVLAALAPRLVLAAAPVAPLPRRLPHVRVMEKSLAREPRVLLDWLLP